MSTHFTSRSPKNDPPAASQPFRAGFNYLFKGYSALDDFFEDNEEEKSLFASDDAEKNPVHGFDQEILILDSGLSPINSTVKRRVANTEIESTRVPVVKKDIVRKVTRSAVKPSLHRVSETENERDKDKLAALRGSCIPTGRKTKKNARHSTSEEQDEAGHNLCDSLKEHHQRRREAGENWVMADSLADRIKRCRRHSGAISSKERIISEVKDYKLQKKESTNTTIHADHDRKRHSQCKDDSKRGTSMAKARLTTTSNTASKRRGIVVSDFSSSEKRKRGVSEEHPTIRKLSGLRPKRTCATIVSKVSTVSTSVLKVQGAKQAAVVSRRPLEKSLGTGNAMAPERSLKIQTKPKRCIFAYPALRSRVPAQEAKTKPPKPKTISQVDVTTRARKNNGMDISPTHVHRFTGAKQLARTDHADRLDIMSGKHTRDYADRIRSMRRGYMTALVDEGGITALRCVSSAETEVDIDWTSDELAALGASPLRQPISPPMSTKAVSLDVPAIYHLQRPELASTTQSLMDSESEVPSLSENKSTSEAETWIETPGQTTEDGSQVSDDGAHANFESVFTTEDAQAAVILAHLAYRGVVGQREKAGIIEQAFNEADQRIVMPRRWIFVNGTLDGITDATPSNQLLIILESEVALIEAQYNIQRSRSQIFSPAHAIFWNQVLLPIKRFLRNYRASNMIITRNNAETILLALSREQFATQLDLIAQKNLQDSTREIIAAMGLLDMGKRV